MEYSCFDFNFLEVDKKVSSLEDFIHFIDAEFEFEFESFSDVLLLCARDVVTGLDYLHSHNIAHRDLKLGNTLVSSQHYITVDGDWAKVYDECPTCQRTQVKKLEQENEKVAEIKHWLSRVLQVRVLLVRVLPVRVLLVQSSPVQSSPRNTVCLYILDLQCFARRHSFAADMIRTNVLSEAVEKRADLPCGYEEDFVNPVDDDLQCSICQLTLRNPVLTRCGHRFCRGCLEQHMSNR